MKSTYLLFIFFLLFSKGVFSQKPSKTIGTASYYANKFEGRKTSTGEAFRQDSLTCAHRTLPFGTILRLTNLKNDSIVIVRVNDRLPKSSKRMVDLTTRAAKQLNFIRAGLTKVSAEIITKEEAVIEKSFSSLDHDLVGREATEVSDTLQTLARTEDLLQRLDSLSRSSPLAREYSIAALYSRFLLSGDEEDLRRIIDLSTSIEVKTSDRMLIPLAMAYLHFQRCEDLEAIQSNLESLTDGDEKEKVLALIKATCK